MNSMVRHVPKPVMFPDAIVKLGAGESFTCALLVAGRVRCFGANAAGQLGNGGGPDTQAPQAVVVQGADGGRPPLSGIVGLSVGGAHACAWNAREVWCWGNNSKGQLAQPQTLAQSSVARLAVAY
jgi:alpha-tubulin suppressor-like RCC1 family protein